MSTFKLENPYDFNLPAVPSTTDPELYDELLTVYTAVRSVANAIERTRKVYVVFSVSIGLGAVVNFFDVAGVPNVRLAQHGVYETHGITTIGASAGNVGEVTLHGIIDFYSGLTAGLPIYTAAVAGQIAGVSPGAGAQRIGYAMNATTIWLNPMLLP